MGTKVSKQQHVQWDDSEIMNRSTISLASTDYFEQKKKLRTKLNRSTENISRSAVRFSTPQLAKDRIEQKNKVEPSASESPQVKQWINKSHNFQSILINANEFRNIREIGKGHFGVVYYGLYKGKHNVALKSLKYPLSKVPRGSFVVDFDDNALKLLQEAHVMSRLRHANILRIIGITVLGNDKKRLCLVTDFMENGSLLDYLRNHRKEFLKVNRRDMLQKLNNYARQIFDAMLYLEEREVIHRDLAARNCLIGEEDTLKVADFGLAKTIKYGVYKSAHSSFCALRWTAPEAVFSSIYSSRSDAWSYGVTLWEIYTLGERPFGKLSNTSVRAILRNPKANMAQYILPPKEFGSDEIYKRIILTCLTYDVMTRPRFRDLKESVSIILANKK